MLFYHVRVFDVCGALQYFSVLSLAAPLLLECLKSASPEEETSDIVYRDIAIVVTAGNNPRIQ